MLKPPAKKIPKNPIWDDDDGASTEKSSDGLAPMNIDDVSLTYSEAEKIIEKDEKNLLRKLLRTDQREFILGTTSATMQATHVLDTLRLSSCNKTERAKRKAFKPELVSSVV